MKRILYSVLVATLPFGSVLADVPKSQNAKVTLVYQHELPNVPGKSIKGVLVERSHSGTEVIVIAPAVRTADAFEFHCILKPFRRAREVSTCLAEICAASLSGLISSYQGPCAPGYLSGAPSRGTPSPRARYIFFLGGGLPIKAAFRETTTARHEHVTRVAKETGDESHSSS